MSEEIFILILVFVLILVVGATLYVIFDPRNKEPEPPPKVQRRDHLGRIR